MTPTMIMTRGRRARAAADPPAILAIRNPQPYTDPWGRRVNPNCIRAGYAFHLPADAPRLHAIGRMILRDHDPAAHLERALVTYMDARLFATEAEAREWSGSASRGPDSGSEPMPGRVYALKCITPPYTEHLVTPDDLADPRWLYDLLADDTYHFMQCPLAPDDAEEWLRRIQAAAPLGGSPRIQAGPTVVADPIGESRLDSLNP